MGLRHTTLGLLAVLTAVLSVFVLLVGVQFVFGEDDDGRTGSAQTVTGRPIDERLAAPGGDIERLRDGEVRLVEVTGIEAGAVATVRQCAAARTDCDPWIPVVADVDGRAVFLFEFRTNVGNREEDCGDERCVLLVRDDTDRAVLTGRLFFGTRASSIDRFEPQQAISPIFGAARDARPATDQLALGLGAAAAFVVVAVALYRRADWQPPEGDAFAGVELDLDPFAGMDLPEDQPAMSRRTKDDSATRCSATT